MAKKARNVLTLDVPAKPSQETSTAVKPCKDAGDRTEIKFVNVVMPHARQKLARRAADSSTRARLNRSPSLSFSFGRFPDFVAFVRLHAAAFPRLSRSLPK